jgi:hypothetical protein
MLAGAPIGSNVTRSGLSIQAAIFAVCDIPSDTVVLSAQGGPREFAFEYQTAETRSAIGRWARVDSRSLTRMT